MLKSYTKFNMEKLHILRATFLTPDRRQYYQRTLTCINVFDCCLSGGFLPKLIEMELCDDMHCVIETSH